MVKKDFELFKKQYKELSEKIEHIAMDIMQVGYNTTEVDKFWIDDNYIEIRFDETCYGETYSEYDSFPIDWLFIESDEELWQAWFNEKERRKEAKRIREEQEEQERMAAKVREEKALYEELKAKYEKIKP